MPARLFTALDTEWQALCRTRDPVRPCSRWAEDPELNFESLTELIARLRGSRSEPDNADQILAALARHASGDDLAARTLLQALLPGLFNVAKRLSRGHIDDDLESEVLAEAIDRIRTYPIERRPTRIAANVTWDVFGRIARRQRRAAGSLIEPIDELEPPWVEATDPSREVCDLVRDALETGRLRPHDARLLLAIAVGHDTIGERARREGIAYAAMNERWRRARNRLRIAVAA